MKISTKQLVIIFIPIILLITAFFYVRYLQYTPLFPEQNKNQEISELPVFPNDPILGSKTGSNTIVAFEDLNCPACKEQQKIFNKLIEKHPNKIKIVWKGLPIKNFPFPSQKAHEYAFCMHRQNKFEKFIELAYANTGNLKTAVLEQISKQMQVDQNKLRTCLNSDKPSNYIKKTKKLAKLLNIQSVPAVFLNGKEIKPSQTVSGWENKLKLN